MARKKKHEEEEHENHERWLITYADMITLLMVLFIVLFSMATVDAKKFEALKDSLAGKHPSPSVLEGAESVLDGGKVQQLDTASQSDAPNFDLPDSFDASAAQQALNQQKQFNEAQQRENNNLEQVRQEIQSALDARGMGDIVKFRRDPTALVVTIVTDQVLFDTGSAEVRPGGKGVLDALVPPLNHLPNPVSVEGHTDNVPINTGAFPSNWELSTARATSVVRYMVEHQQFAPNRIKASGYGEYKPVVPNDSAEHRAQNRRVEVVVHTITGDPAYDNITGVTSQTAETEENSSSGDSQFVPDLPTVPEKPVISLPAANTTKEDHH